MRVPRFLILVALVSSVGLGVLGCSTKKVVQPNLAPNVTLLDPPLGTEITIGTQTIDWRGVDPDGDANLLTYRVWLNGNEASPHLLTTTEFTFPTSDFLEGGKLRTGPRTAFVQAV